MVFIILPDPSITLRIVLTVFDNVFDVHVLVTVLSILPHFLHVFSERELRAALLTVDSYYYGELGLSTPR